MKSEKSKYFKVKKLLLIICAFCFLGLSPGEPVPDFVAKNQDHQEIKLSDYRGKPVLVYFYPKDDTPGCTREACNFRNDYAKFKKFGAVILGISRQTPESHRKFKKEHHLPIDLLVDQTGSIAERLGVKKIPVIGLHRRQSLLVGPDGNLVKFYMNVDPSTHAQEVLADLEALSRAK